MKNPSFLIIFTVYVDLNRNDTVTFCLRQYETVYFTYNQNKYCNTDIYKGVSLLKNDTFSTGKKVKYLCRIMTTGYFILRGSLFFLYVYVLGSDPEAPEEVQGSIGLTQDELGLCQYLEADLAFVFAWLEGKVEPEEGELFLASPAVKNYHINRNLFLLDDHKVLWKKLGEEGEKRLLVVPRELR